MAFTKYILPALAFAGAALAQSNAVCNGPSITIQSSSDAAAIQDCQTYKGDIIIASSAAGTIAINGVQQITGSIKCNNATGLVAITSDQINSIGGDFSLQGLTILSTLQFDSLTSVNNIIWIGLPNLQGLNFAQGVQKANNLYISNTQLYNLEGIELSQIGIFNVNNNPYLNTINVNGLTNVTNALSFSANGRDLQISFPHLEDAANLTFRDVSSVEMPSLNKVQGDMGIYTDLFTSFSAPNLTLIDGTLAFVDSPNLSKISMPILQGIGGGFLIANNTNLLSISGFPELQVIVGAIDFTGTFTEVKLPALRDVRGGSNVQTSGTVNICPLFDTDHNNQVIKGVNTCIYNKANPDQNPTASSGGSSATSTSSGNAAASAFDPSAPLTGLSAIIAALLFI